MKQLLLLILLSTFLFSCDDDSWKTELEAIKTELANQKALIEALQNNASITGIEQGNDSYTIHFSDGQSITLTNGQTPIISIGENGNWFINGVDTGKPSQGENGMDGTDGIDGQTPIIEIGENGNWIINGEDTGIISHGNDALEIVSIVDNNEYMSFYFSDGSIINVVKNEDSLLYEPAPDEGYEYFEYQVDTYNDMISNHNVNLMNKASSVSKDNGFIRLPESYSRNGIPTRLVIINHGAGGRVTDSSSENGNSSFALLLQKKGYAVLCINGVPENMRNTNYMSAEQNGAAAHMGSWIFIRSALAAYNYVTTKYNIAKDGCFVIGRSMGGVSSLNLALSGVIPVKALALDAPVIDAFHDAYFSGNWSGGNLGGKTAAIFAWIYQWDYCNFNDNTYSIPIGEYNIFGQTYNVQTEETKPLANLYQNTQDMAILWHLNETKMIGYNGYKTGDFLVKNLDENYVYNLSTDNDDKYYGKKLPCPCKIWFGSGDTVNQLDIAKRFVQKVRNGGSIAILRTCPTNRHCVWSETETIPEGTDISVIEDGITCSPYAVELWNWIKRWDGI